MLRRKVLALGFCAAFFSCGAPGWTGGIHALLVASPRGLRVIEVPTDSPAEHAGLRGGDAIVAIDGKPIVGLASARIHELLSGEVGSTVELQILRDGTAHIVRVRRAPYAAKRAQRPANPT